MAEQVAFLKRGLRQQQGLLRGAVALVHPDAANQVRDRFLAWFRPCFQPSQTQIVAGTWPIRSELDARPLMQALAGLGHMLCLPVLNPSSPILQFRHFCFGDTLLAQHYGIKVPEAHQPLRTPQLVLCPLLAFDRKGGRLGYGGGYYDATLRGLRRHGPITAIGLAYAAQEVANVPTDAWDEGLDMVVTEKEVIGFKKA